MAMSEAAKAARKAYYSTPEQKAKRREYMKKWNAKNPGKQQEYQIRHWEKKAAELEAQNKQEV